jgi:hypothetical protein
MIIGACGYGATGSSVITDFFREFDDVQVFDDFEFSFTYRVDGLEDLEYHLMKQYAKGISGDAAIKRFLYAANYIRTPFIHKPTNKKEYLKIVNEYINKLLQVKYRGMESIDIISGNVFKNIINLGMKKVILPLLYERQFKKVSFIWPNRDVYLAVEPVYFYEASKEFIRNILISMGADLTIPIVLDQPFAGNSPFNSFKFFDQPKAIVIDRDPRDLYLEAKYSLSPEGRFIPRQNVQSFCEYYMRIRTNQTYKDTDRILYLKFEDLIYNYEQSIEKIKKFTNLERHNQAKKYFNPLRSINNTQLFRKYANEKDNIKYIEEHLIDFLYDYSSVKYCASSGEMFTGSAKYQSNLKSSIFKWISDD